MKSLVLKNAHVITCNGDGILRDQTLLIEERIISSIQEEGTLSITNEADVIDIDGGYVLPGLITCHEHVLMRPDRMPTEPEVYEHVIMYGAVNALELLQNGFTTVRSMSDFWNLEMVLRDAINSGVIEGPSLVVTGIGMSATGGHFEDKLHCCDTVELAAAHTKAQLDKGADFIKVFLTGGVTTVGTTDEAKLGEEQLKTIISTAHAAGKKVAAHCIGQKGVILAARAGVDSIEHGCGLDEESVSLIRQKGIILVPTILPGYMNFISPRRKFFPKFFLEKSDQYLEDCRKAAVLARTAGVKIALGTDGGAPNTPHSGGAQELLLLSELGYTPMECLHAATDTAAELLGLLNDRGTVETGKRADLIVVEENPLENLATLKNIKHVLKAGKLIR